MLSDLAKLSGKRDSYEFKSTVFEPSLIAEYHPFTITSPALDFYALAGIGVTFSDIKGNDITYKAQRNVYLNTPVIPFGVGYKYNFKNGLQIGAEFNFRAALMDNDNHNLDGFPYDYNGPHPSTGKPFSIRRGLTSRSSSFSRRSLISFLKTFMDCPTLRAISGRRLAPKTSKSRTSRTTMCVGENFTALLLG